MPTLPREVVAGDKRSGCSAPRPGRRWGNEVTGGWMNCILRFLSVESKSTFLTYATYRCKVSLWFLMFALGGNMYVCVWG